MRCQILAALIIYRVIADMIDAPKSKYYETRALIQHACDNGFTQRKIAELCNVTQSIVSDWLNEKRTANRMQLRPLLDQFGDIGSQKKAAVYLIYEHKGFVINAATIKVFETFFKNAHKDLADDSRWRREFKKELPDYRRPRRITDPELLEKFESEIQKYEEAVVRLEKFKNIFDRKQALKKIADIRLCRLMVVSREGELFETKNEFLALFNELPSNDILAIFTVGSYKNLKNDMLAASHSYDTNVVQIYGDILFEYTFNEDPADPGPMWSQHDEKIPWMKWVIHELGNGRFCWLVMQPKNVYLNIKTRKQPYDVWLSRVEKSDNAESILSAARQYLSENALDYLIDQDALLFLITKSFLDRGYPVEGVKVINGPIR